MSIVTYLEVQWHRHEYYTQLPSGDEKFRLVGLLNDKYVCIADNGAD
jgi:hypothetical protein